MVILTIFIRRINPPSRHNCDYSASCETSLRKHIHKNNFEIGDDCNHCNNKADENSNLLSHTYPEHDSDESTVPTNTSNIHYSHSYGSLAKDYTMLSLVTEKIIHLKISMLEFIPRNCHKFCVAME